MKFCIHCGTQLSEGAMFCGNCGTPCNIQATPPQGDPAQAAQSNDTLFDALTGTVNKFAGGSGKVRPPLGTIFGKTFTKHSRDEAEEIFACGTATTTPVLSGSSTAWPQPWLYSRILLAFAAAFVLLHLCSEYFQNLNTYPGTIVIGSFMVPVAVLVFFFELNTTKNISFFTTAKIFLVGGCASFLCALVLFEIFPVDELDYTGAIMVGIIEELAKLAIVAVFINQEKDAKYAVNGLLIGAAVGAGFAAVESAGYAFRILLETGSYSEMIGNIFLRGVLAPGGHVVWAAMSGYGIMMARENGQGGSAGFMGSSKFWRIFWIPVTLHAIWDMPIEIGGNVPVVPIVLVLMSWVVIFVLISNCLNQIGRELQRQTMPPEAPEPAPVGVEQQP